MIRGVRSRGETDITAVFGTAIPGSNPGGSTDVATCTASTIWRKQVVYCGSFNLLYNQPVPACALFGGPCPVEGELQRGEGGYGLVVERVLAKDEIGVRFPVSAQK